mgnify:CR=1 FL=1
MIALLIHFLGSLLIDSAVPPYVVSADAYFLAWWYAAFAAVDLIALCLATPRLRIILALSFAWSAALSIESLMLKDILQRRDWSMQVLIDSTLFVYLILLLFRLKAKTKTERQRP